MIMVLQIEADLQTAQARAGDPEAAAAQAALSVLRKGTQTRMKTKHQPSQRVKMTEATDLRIQNNTKRRQTVVTVLDSLANLMATGLTHEAAVDFDPKWEQDVAKLRVRAAQEIDALEQDVLACQQHASWERDQTQRRARRANR